MTAQLASEGPLTPQDYRTQTSSRNLHPLGRMRELLEWAAATDLPASAHGTLAALAVHMDDAGAAFPPQATLARLAGLSERTVRRVVPQLERLGFFTRVVPPPRERALRLSTVYQLRLPGLENQPTPRTPTTPRRGPGKQAPQAAPRGRSERAPARPTAHTEHRPTPAKPVPLNSLEVPTKAPAILEPQALLPAANTPTDPQQAPAIIPAGAPDTVTKSTGHGDLPRLPMKSENAANRPRFSPTSTTGQPLANRKPQTRTSLVPAPSSQRPKGTLEDAACTLPADLRALVARIGAKLAAGGYLMQPPTTVQPVIPTPQGPEQKQPGSKTEATEDQQPHKHGSG